MREITLSNAAVEEWRQRIERSQQAIADCPKWVRDSMIFHGGGIRRGDQ